MRSGSLERDPDPSTRMVAGLTFLIATTVRVSYALGFPTIHGGDAAARLANADTLILGYQLPLPQAFVMLGKAILDDPILVRLIFCVWGGSLAAGLVALLSRVLDSSAAIFGGILLSFDPLLVHYSIVPYQEGVAYSLVAWSFYVGTSHRKGASGLLMAAACLSRYEAWLFLPAFFWVTRSRTALLIAVAPIAGWILWWQGLAPSGLYVLDVDLQSSRWSRVLFLLGKLQEYETASALALAALAILLALTQGPRVTLWCAAALTAVIVMMVAFGHEYPPGSGQMSERLIHLPVLLVLLLCAGALSRISSHSRLALGLCVTTVLLIAGRGVRFETALLRAAAREPDLALARDVARVLDSNRSADECVSVAAPSVDPALLDAYVAKVGAGFGDVTRARERAASLRETSPDRDRIAAHLRAKAGTVRGKVGCPLLVLVDDAGRPGAEPKTLIAEVSAGVRRAKIYRTRR